MGKNCENVIDGIGMLLDSLTSAIISVSEGSSYQLNVSLLGKEEIVNGHIPLESISESISKLKEDGDKLIELGSKLFVNPKKYNNSYGSPWGEMNNLYRMIRSIQSLNPDLRYMGDRIVALGLMNACLTIAIDAKYALQKNHDNIQQGYDKEYNDNNPSMAKKIGVDSYGTGNITQNFEENVCYKTPNPYESPF